MLGFFTCGFQLAFITVHLPAYLADRGLSADVGGWTLAAIGLFNIMGALSAGWLSERMPKRYLLSLLYFGRATAILAFILFPITAFTCIVFGAVMGLMWLSTVPPTNGIIVVMFGTRWLAMLSGVTFFSHQAKAISVCCQPECAGRQVEHRRSVRIGHQHQPESVKDSAGGEHTGCAEPVGDRTRDGLCRAPQKILHGEGEREDVAAPMVGAR